ncbi:hypothetical protein DFH29DRAFT_897504 [Suillus ampliporus]|nr:hypothetical protein DFH29DRAFT_897504 [Suillus ampliporus]
MINHQCLSLSSPVFTPQNAMARTKQTGETAKHVTLTTLPLETEVSPEELQVAKATVPAQALEMVPSHLDVRSEPPKNHFCMFCQFGVAEGVSIYECDEVNPDCPRVTCSRCISIPSNCLQEVTQPGVKFQCFHCHTASTKKLGQGSPYYGFYMNGEPVLSSFLHVTGQLAFSRRSQISSVPILIIHFKVAGCEATASTIDATHSYLARYFPHGGLRLVEVVFDLTEIEDYSKRCEKLVNNVMEDHKYDRVVIAISNHTYDANSDIPEFMDTLLNPWRDVIQRTTDTTLFLFGGAIVNQPESFRGLRTSIVSHGISSTVAFTATRFRPSSFSRLMITFAQSVLIEGFSLRKAFPDIVDQSGLGMQSDVILMTVIPGNNYDSPAGPLQSTRYLWGHSTTRPWGTPLPLQCPQCGCLAAWKKTHADFSRKCIIFECSYTGCGRANRKPSERLPRKKYTCQAPKGSKMLPGGTQGACWLEIPLDFSRSNAVTGFLDSGDIEMV